MRRFVLGFRVGDVDAVGTSAMPARDVSRVAVRDDDDSVWEWRVYGREAEREWVEFLLDPEDEILARALTRLDLLGCGVDVCWVLRRLA